MYIYRCFYFSHYFTLSICTSCRTLNHLECRLPDRGWKLRKPKAKGKGRKMGAMEICLRDIKKLRRDVLLLILF